MTGLVIYTPEGVEHYNSETHSKLVYQQELKLTNWVEERRWASYYTDVTWINPEVYFFTLPGINNLIIDYGRVYLQSPALGLQNISRSTVITVPVFRIV